MSRQLIIRAVQVLEPVALVHSLETAVPMSASLVGPVHDSRRPAMLMHEVPRARVVGRGHQNIPQVAVRPLIAWASTIEFTAVHVRAT